MVCGRFEVFCRLLSKPCCCHRIGVNSVFCGGSVCVRRLTLRVVLVLGVAQL